MTYHETIIDLIFHILSQGKEYLNLIGTRNAYDKLLRNYHQVNAAGYIVYRNNRAKEYYRFSKKAWQPGNSQPCYYEHLIPIKIMKEELAQLIDKEMVSISAIRAILEKNEIVVITKDEARMINKKHKSTIPNSGKDRLIEHNITMAPKTKKNSIWKI
jgi:hypothetical protein